MTEVVKHSSDKAAPIELTQAARNRILSCLHENKHLALRLSLKKTGCSGLSYVMDYVDIKQTDDLTVELDDKFVFIEKKSFPYLKGIKIDYVRQGINQKFTFENPNQTGQCGCGESFSVDD
jgi:iron-sulfur cluster assembly protein